MLIAGIDPGPMGAAHGWALLDHERGMPPRWVDGGHDKTDPILARLRGLSLAGVVVETPSGYVWSFERGAGLLATSRAAGHLQGRFEALGLRVATPSAQDWRGLLCANPSADDDAVSRMLASRLRGMPVRTNVHARDAMGAALAVALGWRPAPVQAKLPLGPSKRGAKSKR